MQLFGTFYLALSLATGLLLPLPFSRKTKLLIGPALGIVLITQLTLITSLAFGFTVPVIWGTLITFALLIVLINGLTYQKLFKIPKFNSKFLNFNFLKTHWPFFLILLILGPIVFFVFWTKVLYPTPMGLATGGGGMYGDTAMHSAFTMSLVEQGLPPQNPLFAGSNLVYPFMVNLFSAILVKVGFTLRFAFILPQFAYFLGFLTLFYTFTKKYTSNVGSFFAMLIFFLGWGLGFTEYLAEAIQTGSWAITKEFTNNIPGYALHNVLTGIVFPARSLLPGLFIGMLITHLATSLRDDKKATFTRPILIGLFLGILPLWHTHTFLFFAVSVGIWMLYRMFSLISMPKQQRKTVLIEIVVLTVVAGIFILPTLYWFSQQVSQKTFVSFLSGWEVAEDNFLLFWWKNTGVLIPLALVGMWLLRKSREWIVFAPAFVMFVVANLISFQPWSWDNIKIFSWVFLFMSILAGKTLAKLLKTMLLTRMLTLILLLSLIASGTLSVLHALPQTHTIYDKQDLDLAEWVKSNTKPSDVFLVDPWPNHPIAGLTGRSVYLGYPGHLWVHGISYGEREQIAQQILRGAAINIPEEISYIVVEKTKQPALTSYSQLSPIYQNPKFTVLKVNR